MKRRLKNRMTENVVRYFFFYLKKIELFQIFTNVKFVMQGSKLSKQQLNGQKSSQISDKA